MHTGLASWHSQCRHCAYQSAALQPAINQHDHPVLPDEVEREVGLLPVRQTNFAQILQLIQRYGPTHPRLLDVGCAHGIFLQQAAGQCQVQGIEPHEAVAEYARNKGLPVRSGYFPEVLAAGEQYDIIVFNDVLEHIPDLPQVLNACYQVLADDGLLVLNLPDADGIIYRTARLLARLGLSGPFERLWQLHYPSPHLHYFSRANLQQLAENHGFTGLHAQPLLTLSRRGLYQRIAHTGEYSVVTAGALTALAWLVSPLLKLLPADIQLQVLRKQGGQQ